MFFTVSAEYARLLSERWKIILGGEYLEGVNAVVFVAPFVVRPWKRSEFHVKFAALTERAQPGSVNELVVPSAVA